MALTYQSRNPHTAVTITVSSHDCKETFIVYKEFLCYYSPFFDAAFNSSFIEGQTQTMEYPDAHPHIFGISFSGSTRRLLEAFATKPNRHFA
jgi:hypothetical protein